MVSRDSEESTLELAKSMAMGYLEPLRRTNDNPKIFSKVRTSYKAEQMKEARGCSLI